MTLIRFYVHHEKIVLPTVAETEAGFYVDVEPIEVIPVDRRAQWRRHLFDSLSHANQIIPTPERSDDPGSAMLEKLRIQKWSTFEKSSIMYTVHSSGGTIRIYRTGKAPDGMWTTETNERQFASRTPIDLIVDALEKDILQQPEANRPKTSLMLAKPEPEPPPSNGSKTNLMLPPPKKKRD